MGLLHRFDSARRVYGFTRLLVLRFDLSDSRMEHISLVRLSAVGAT
jgi:hypothetical protein